MGAAGMRPVSHGSRRSGSAAPATPEKCVLRRRRQRFGRGYFHDGKEAVVITQGKSLPLVGDFFRQLFTFDGLETVMRRMNGEDMIDMAIDIHRAGEADFFDGGLVILTIGAAVHIADKEGWNGSDAGFIDEVGGVVKLFASYVPVGRISITGLGMGIKEIYQRPAG